MCKIAAHIITLPLPINILLVHNVDLNVHRDVWRSYIIHLHLGQKAWIITELYITFLLRSWGHTLYLLCSRGVRISRACRICFVLKSFSAGNVCAIKFIFLDIIHVRFFFMDKKRIANLIDEYISIEFIFLCFKTHFGIFVIFAVTKPVLCFFLYSIERMKIFNLKIVDGEFVINLNYTRNTVFSFSRQLYIV